MDEYKNFKPYEFDKLMTDPSILIFEENSSPMDLKIDQNNPMQATMSQTELTKKFLHIRALLGLNREAKELSPDISISDKWVGDDWHEMPRDRKYQNCILKISNK